MKAVLRSLFAILVLLNFVAVTQDASKLDEHPCIGRDETIYHPGEDHVKAPELHRERLGPDNKGIRPNSHVMLEVTVNATGAICEVRALKAPSRQEAQTVSEYVADNFKFKPATRHGKPVAVRFQVEFRFFP